MHYVFEIPKVKNNPPKIVPIFFSVPTFESFSFLAQELITDKLCVCDPATKWPVFTSK